MYNTKLILDSGEEIYPGYMDKEQRAALKDQMGSKKEVIRCGCKLDGNLFYRISEDLKIYPEHNNYEHNKQCSRYKSSAGKEVRQTGYLINEEEGGATVYLTFNPKSFSQGQENEETEEDNQVADDQPAEEEIIVEKEESTKNGQTEIKEPKLNLADLIRGINVDTFTEKVLNYKNIESRDTFSKCVYHRMKQVKISRMKKNIGDLSLEKDGVRFIYIPFSGAIQKKEKGITKCFIQSPGANGEIFNNLIFPDTLEKVMKKFVKCYGIEPDENTMLAGFQYLKKTRAGHAYKVLGRVHLFQVSDIGIYCSSLIEKEAFNTICEVVKEGNIKFWIPPEDKDIGGILQVKDMKKQIVLLFRTAKDERFSVDTSIYKPMIIGKDTPLTRDYLLNFIGNLEDKI